MVVLKAGEDSLLFAHIFPPLRFRRVFVLIRVSVLVVAWHECSRVTLCGAVKLQERPALLAFIQVLVEVLNFLKTFAYCSC